MPLSDFVLRFVFRPLLVSTVVEFPAFLFLVELAAERIEARPPWLLRYSVRISCAVSLRAGQCTRTHTKILQRELTNSLQAPKFGPLPHRSLPI